MKRFYKIGRLCEKHNTPILTTTCYGRCFCIECDKEKIRKDFKEMLGDKGGRG